jgi:KTSC domain
MDWIATPESSNIARMAYDSVTQVLKIEFKNGGTYDYFDVPQNVFEAMLTASSKGQYLAQQIKGNYRYARA